jgi:hypothetical protein
VDGRRLNGDATDREASFGPFHLIPARQMLLCGGQQVRLSGPPTTSCLRSSKTLARLWRERH